MSEPGIHQRTESSEQGLTFLKPMAGTFQPADRDADRSSVRRGQATLAERLFPPKSQEDSGATLPVTGLELGHFVLEEQIGRGGMGAVFRAMDSRLGRVVALKVLSPEHSADSEAVIRFQNEARAAARLDHGNVARVYYIGEQNGLHFIAFEFVSGTNIRNFILQKGRLNPADAVNYTLQIAEALRHTAAANVIHRDIKPSNIIVTPTGKAKLVDLGLARYIAPDISRDLTVDGTALGTFDYIAPEQALNARNVDIRADIYSLGCTLYHMLAGEPPYPKGTMFEKVMNHHRPTAPDPAAKNPAVTPELSRIVQKMMSSNPDERYSSPEALIGDLSRLAESLGIEPTFPDTAVWVMPPYSRRRSHWEGTRTWGAVALVLLMLTILAGRMGSDRRPLSVALGPSAEQLPISEGASTLRSTSPTRTEVSATTTTEPGVSVVVPLPASQELRNSAEERRELEAGMKETVNVLKELLVATAAPVISLDVSKTLGQVPHAEAVPSVIPPTVPSATYTGSSSLEPRSASELPAAVSEPFVIVSPGSMERIRMPTLAAACAAAPDNSVIEIQADGPLPLQQESIKISNKRIRVRPAQDQRPIVRFDLSSRLTIGSFSRTAEVIHVDRGAVEFYDLDLELIVDPESVVDLWAMVTLVGGSEFVARGVSLTLANTSQLPAALLNIPDLEPTNLDSLMPDRMMVRKTSVVLSECFCRGEADFASQRKLDNIDYRLDNVGFAMSGALFRIDGSTSFAGTMEPDDAPTTNVQFSHVTAVSGDGLLRAAAGEHGLLPVFNIEMSDSVFRVDQSESPLISLSGPQDFDVLQETLSFRRSNDPSFFNSLGPFCRIESTTSLFADTRETDADQFGVIMTQFGRENLLTLPRPVNLSLMHEIQPTELMLRQESAFINPARDSSGDLQDAGVDWSLPRVPMTLPVVKGNGLSVR